MEFIKNKYKHTKRRLDFSSVDRTGNGLNAFKFL